MDIKIITYNHLVNDTLTPQNYNKRCNNIVRTVLKQICAIKITDDTDFFKILPLIMSNAGVYINRKILAEWRKLSALRKDISCESIDLEIERYRWKHLKTKLFMIIAGHFAEYYLCIFFDKLKKKRNNQIRALFIMQTLKAVGQLIDDNNAKDYENERQQHIKNGITCLLAFIWYQIYYNNHITSMTALTITPEEVADILNYNEEYEEALNALLQRENSIILGKIKGFKEKKKETENKEEVYLKPYEIELKYDIRRNKLLRWRETGVLKDYIKIKNRYEYNEEEIKNEIKRLKERRFGVGIV